MAHLTGGGFVDNLPRILPPALAAELWTHSWAIPPLFQWLVATGGLAQEEAYRVWNMGIGMVLVVGEAESAALRARLPAARVIGQLVASQQQPVPVRLVGAP